MSVTGRFWRLASEEWPRIESLSDSNLTAGQMDRSEEAFLDTLFDDRWLESGHYLDIEKSWHLLDYLLRHVRDVPEAVLGQAIQGGTDLPFRDCDGFIRFLTPDEVRVVADHLGRQSVARLQACCKMDELLRAEIYPGFDQWDSDAVRGLVEQYFPLLVTFYRAAARAGQYVVLGRM